MEEQEEGTGWVTELFYSWKASCTTGCIPTLQGNDKVFYFGVTLRKKFLGTFFSLFWGNMVEVVFFFCITFYSAT